MASQGWKRRLVYGLGALGISVSCCLYAANEDLIRFTYHVPGDSKPVVLHADVMATWVEAGQRVVLLRGKALMEHGVVQGRMQQAVVWIDQERYRQTGIRHVHVYGEGEVTVEYGPEARSGPRTFIDLSTRGEVKMRANDSKIIQEPQTNDPVYRRAMEIRASQIRANADGPVKQASFQDPAPSGPDSAPQQKPVPVQGGSAPPVPGPAPPGDQKGGQDPFPATPAMEDAPVARPGKGPDPFSGPAFVGPPTPSLLTDPGAFSSSGASPSSPSGDRPTGVVAPPPLPGGLPGPRAAGTGPLRNISIQPRNAASYGIQGFERDGENVVVATGGVILLVRSSDRSGLLDIEADRLVLWTREKPERMISNLRSQEGHTSNQVEFYLAGNVEIRSQSGPESRTLRANEIYYDVSRNVAVAMQADLEFRQPGFTDPVHLKAEELLQLSPTLFKGVKAEVFASKLPSDPGVKVYVEEATMEEKEIPKKSIFGRQYINRQTGKEETEHQRLFDGQSVFLKFEDVPVFYLPYLRGDANDPLGPLQSVEINYNRIYGAKVATTFNVYDLIGMDPLPGTRWHFDVDYLSRRGPGLGSDFDYHANDFFGAPARLEGLVKAYGMHDGASDILGGDRGSLPHPEWRGRLLWRQNVLDLPEGFSLQSQVAALSDKNFLEQYYQDEFANGINQETFLYLKQQQNNWAWTLLTEQRIRNWVTETSWLPRADGFLLGQSFFDIFTYNVHGSAGYARLTPTHVPPPPFEITDAPDKTGRFDLFQELSAPFNLGPFRVVPYGDVDLTYYTEDLTRTDRGRFYGAGGMRSSIPFSRLYSDVQSDLFNLNGINHKIVLSSNYYVAHSDTSFLRLPQLDRLNDDATDQALRDIKTREIEFNPAHGALLAFSPLYDPQRYAIRRLVDNRTDTLDTIEVIEADLRQRWQTKRGYPGQQHIVDWMTLDLSGSFFPHPRRDNFGESLAFLEYDWLWNIGDRTALVSTGWIDPIDNGARVYTFGAYLNRPDRTNFFIGYREINPLKSQAVTGAVTYVFSPKYALTANATFDFAANIQTGSILMTRMGSDLQVSLGFNFNSTLNTVGVSFEIVPNIFPQNRRPGLVQGTSLLGGKQ